MDKKTVKLRLNSYVVGNLFLSMSSIMLHFLTTSLIANMKEQPIRADRLKCSEFTVRP